jgi:mannose-1-phosphate guanylyltransferase
LIHVVILAGGSGTRFWPKSRRQLPKQFLRFGEGEPLLVETAERMRRVAPPERTWVVTAAAHVARVRALLPGLPAEQVVGEPAPRDTAPAVALAALKIARRDPDATLLVCPADHRIEPAPRLAAAIGAAEELVARDPGRIVVFGIAPTAASTGYGYVEPGDPLGTFQALPAYDVKQFHEKPDAKLAAEYVAGGRHWWNAGIACFRATALREEIARQMPELARGLAELEKCADERRFAAELARLFPTFERRSIDHGGMEHARARRRRPRFRVGRRRLLPRAGARDEAGRAGQRRRRRRVGARRPRERRRRRRRAGRADRRRGARRRPHRRRDARLPPRPL